MQTGQGSEQCDVLLVGTDSDVAVSVLHAKGAGDGKADCGESGNESNVVWMWGELVMKDGSCRKIVVVGKSLID